MEVVTIPNPDNLALTQTVLTGQLRMVLDRLNRPDTDLDDIKIALITLTGALLEREEAENRRFSGYRGTLTSHDPR